MIGGKSCGALTPVCDDVMQPMARPGFKVYPDAAPVAASAGLRWLLGLDLIAIFMAAVAATVWGPRFIGVWDSARFDTPHLLALAWALLAAGATVGCLGLRPFGITWRRRLGIIAVIGVLLSNGPCTHTGVKLAVVVWTGAVVVATLVAGRTIARSIVDATGEEGLGEDPSRHL